MSVAAKTFLVVLGTVNLPALAATLDREGTLWAPYIEWSLENRDNRSANPFDLQASATFVHESSGEQHTTAMFYDGNRTWKFRFTATRTGEWTFTTRSTAMDLDGHRGTLRITPNLNQKIKGFVVADGNKWARQVGEQGEKRAFVPQYVLYDRPGRFHNQPQKIDADIQEFLVGHGFSGFHVVSPAGNWFDHRCLLVRDVLTSASTTNPERRTFEALEQLIARTHAAGGVVHLWMWDRHDNPSELKPEWGGPNGVVAQRLYRYIAARLGPLPGWTMGYGWDLELWVNGAEYPHELENWHAFLHTQFGWPHLLGARATKNELSQLYEGLDYASYMQHRPDYQRYLATLAYRPTKPAFSEDIFRIRNHQPYVFKDYNEAMTRRGMWQSTLAGGIANSWGNLLDMGEGHGRLSQPYANKDQIKTYARFFEHRFLNDLQPDSRLTDQMGLCNRGNNNYVFYGEDVDQLRLDLSKMTGALPGVAVDTKRPYQEIDVGDLQPRSQVWRAPYPSDWAIAVGVFSGDED